MDAIWSALADPRRRAMLDVLREGGCPVGELASRLGLSQPTTSKHLRVLREAELVLVRKDAQQRVYAVDPERMAELDAWLAPYRRLWADRLDALGRHLDEGRDMNDGVYVEHEGRPAVRFRRGYEHPVERLWRALTDPDELPCWFPSKVTMEPRVGGRVEFSGDPNLPSFTGTVLAYEPPRRLAYSWGADELHFELEPAGPGGCVLTLTNVLEAKDTAARNAAGWEICLAGLGNLVAGVAAGGPHAGAAEPWRRHYDSYVAAGMPSGAAIPGQASSGQG